MPCRDYYPTDSETRANKEQALIRSLLCEACNLIDEKQMSKTLRKWWRAHKAADAKRQAEEKERKRLDRIAAKAMAKLTTEDVEALRFKGYVLPKK